jgi:hypothetical protein
MWHWCFQACKRFGFFHSEGKSERLAKTLRRRVQGAKAAVSFLPRHPNSKNRKCFVSPLLTFANYVVSFGIALTAQRSTMRTKKGENIIYHSRVLD